MIRLLIVLIVLILLSAFPFFGRAEFFLTPECGTECGAAAVLGGSVGQRGLNAGCAVGGWESGGALVHATADSLAAGDWVATNSADSFAVYATADSVSTSPKKENFFRRTISRLTSQDQSSRKFRFLGCLAPFFTPETSLAFVFGGQMYFYGLDRRFNQEIQSAKSKKVSHITVDLEASIKAQFSAEFKPEFYFLNHKLALRGYLTVAKWVNYFYGLGDECNYSPYEESFSQFFAKTNVYALYGVLDNLYTGFGLKYYHYRLITDSVNGFTNRDVLGNRPVNGLSYVYTIRYDKRDDNIRPLKGSLIDAEILYNAHGSRYGRFYFDGRQYINIKQKDKEIDHVFAGNLLLDFCFGGNVPYQEMPRISGVYHAHGILKDRFVDFNTVCLQLEYRFYYRWFGFAVFGSFSNASRDILNAFVINKIAYGAGIRLKPLKSAPISIRANVGLFKDQGLNTYKPGVYIGINEIF